jgi:hypothetical protein
MQRYLPNIPKIPKIHKTDQKLFAFGTVVGFVALSIAVASVPKRDRITDDTAIYQKLSEISVPRESAPNFDGDIQRLSNLEPRYREKLPLSKQARIKGPLSRISKQPYRYSSPVTR